MSKYQQLESLSHSKVGKNFADQPIIQNGRFQAGNDRIRCVPRFSTHHADECISTYLAIYRRMILLCVSAFGSVKMTGISNSFNAVINSAICLSVSSNSRVTG